MKKVQRGEIYFADLGQTEGSEQRGIRPVVILQNDIGNKHSPTTIVAPITSRQKKAHFPCHIPVFINGQTIGVVELEQIRTIDKCRLTSYLGELNCNNMQKVDSALCISLGLPLA